MKEASVEMYFVSQVKQRGGIALKFIAPGMIGVPDRIVLLPGGRMFFAELKAPGQKPRPTQLAAHRMLEKLGFKVYVVDSKELAKEVIANEV